MPLDFNLADLNQIIAIKFCLYAFLVLGGFLIWFKAKNYWFLLLYSILSALAYYIFVNDMGLMFWGLKGDEVTIAAMYYKMSSLGWADFSYSHLPPFYPPLFFYIFGLVGKFFSFNGIQIAKLATLCSFLTFPSIVYFVQKWYWDKREDDKVNLPNKIVFFLTPIVICLFIDWDAFIQKPYEALAAVLAVLWFSFLVLDIARKKFSWVRIFVYGITGGLIFMTYYLWLIFAGIGVSLYALSISKKDQFRFYGRLLLVGAVVLIVASPYLVPLVSAYKNGGSENWQTIFLTSQGISFQAMMFKEITWRSILMFFGLFSLLYFYKRPLVKIWTWMFATSYLWHLLGLTTVFFFATPIQEFKGFYFFDRIILALALAYGIGEVWRWAQSKKWFERFRQPILFVGLAFLSTQMFFGFFIDEPLIQIRLVQSKFLRPGIQELVDYLKTDNNLSEKLTLHSGIGELNAFVPLNNFIYFNQHNSNPAALFSGRFSYIKWLSLSKDAEEFYKLLATSPYGQIDRLIFFKSSENYYRIYFEMDNFPNMSRSEVIEIPKKLFDPDYFSVAFENREVIIFDIIRQ